MYYKVDDKNFTEEQLKAVTFEKDGEVVARFKFLPKTPGFYSDLKNGGYVKPNNLPAPQFCSTHRRLAPLVLAASAIQPVYAASTGEA